MSKIESSHTKRIAAIKRQTANLDVYLLHEQAGNRFPERLVAEAALLRNLLNQLISEVDADPGMALLELLTFCGLLVFKPGKMTPFLPWDEEALAEFNLIVPAWHLAEKNGPVEIDLGALDIQTQQLHQIYQNKYPGQILSRNPFRLPL